MSVSNITEGGKGFGVDNYGFGGIAVKADENYLSRSGGSPMG